MPGYVIPMIVIIAIGGVLLAATMYMEWVGIMNLLTPSKHPRHDGCGHIQAVPTDEHARCWRCRHASAIHAITAPLHKVHLTH